MHAKSLQSCNTLCHPMDCSLTVSSVHGILQARILKWVAKLSWRGSSQPRDWSCISHDSCNAGHFFTTETMGRPNDIMKVKVKSLSHVQLFATPWTVAYQASLSMGFSRQEYWIVFPFPSPGDLPDPGIKPRSPTLQADALPSEPPGKLQLSYCLIVLPVIWKSWIE